MEIIKLIRKSVQNIPGWSSRRQIVVFESDDWGSVRMPSKKMFNRLVSYGINAENCNYLMYDNFETNEDLSALLDVLKSVKDKNGNYAKLTANVIVANPDFDRIRNSGYLEYFYKTLPETIEQYPESNQHLTIITQAKDAGLFIPQFHGREHVNISRWLKDLQLGIKETIDAFDCDVYGLSMSARSYKGKNYLPALDYDDFGSKQLTFELIKDGLHIFNNVFGFHSKTFIAPAYTWSDYHEVELNKYGIEALQGNPYQKLPSGESNNKKKFHFTGQYNKLGQVYLVRNAYFEPTILGSSDAVSRCLNQISNAFFWKKPAIVGCHRLNFMGGIVTRNRTENLKLFRLLLKEILRKWPDVEFFSSDQLSSLINNKG
ncbi:hypothetical protein GCM10027036_38780 [Flavihumibacter cheonanensis]|uniref:hypothetical protein n=1 Tax=Flavihumibacter cheonanensis TaxID=1442385 RepID=UPI001EF92FDA|nr:hypothetical protein [Flavihumibacter cheonanensis]MCG7753881.1 hypothetical protein [Flavihumibacter cheonanensis]